VSHAKKSVNLPHVRTQEAQQNRHCKCPSHQQAIRKISDDAKFWCGTYQPGACHLGRTRQAVFIQQQGFVGELFADEDDVRLEDFLSTINNSEIQVIGPELIFGQLYDKIGYGAIKSDLFRHLVVSRLYLSLLLMQDCYLQTIVNH